MSSVGISGAQQNLQQYIQSLNSNLLGQTSAATTSTPATQTSDTSATTQVSSGQHHGGGSGFLKQVQSAVTSALQNAQTSGSTTDPNDVIQTAIKQVLQNQQGGSSESEALPGTADSDSDASSSVSSFASLLQSNGVDPAQFHQDFLSAIQSAQSGNPADPSGIFSGFPAGSVVDTIA